jgi:hypothetical protein
MKWIVFSGATKELALAAFNTQLDAFNSAFGYPTADGLTVTYSIPFPHPDTDTFKIAMPIEDRCLPLLSADQLQALTSVEKLESAGWFAAPQKKVTMESLTSPAAAPVTNKTGSRLLKAAAAAAGAAAIAHFAFHWF